MGLIQEFKEFAMRGNVVDMAVGVIMGGAFGKIVTSLTNDVLMPPIGYLTGGVKFTELKYTLPQLKIPMPDPSNPGKMIEKVLAPVTINYGQFLQNTFDFLIIALCIFALVKAMNTVMRKKAEAPAPPEPTATATATEKLLAEIRDSLKAK